MKDLIRITLGVLLLIAVWMGYSWAMKLAVTLAFFGNEASGIILSKIRDDLKWPK